MGANKGSSKAPSFLVPPLVDKSARWALGPGRPAVLLLLIFGGFFGAWLYAWRSVGPWLLSQRDYQLTAEDIEIAPSLPPWIHAADIRREALFYAGLDAKPLSILDEDVVDRVSRAFSFHPWVAKVVSVRKRHPAQVTVEVVYRRPVCVVPVGEGRYPVDVEGVLLPADNITPIEMARFPRLSGVQSTPAGLPGTRWSDPRVAGGAEVAAALLSSWEKLGLDRIEARPDGPASGDFRYVLRTARGSTIDWGRAASSRSAGEPSADEKAALVIDRFRENGSLDAPDGSPQAFSVAGGREKR